MNGPVEPNASLRQMAAILRGMFIALIEEGFTERQALAIIGEVIAANAGQEES